MTRNTLMGGVLAGILFLSTLALADDPPKAMTALVFINDAYAGRVQDLRSMSLEPGVYSLSIETEGRPGFARRVYVLCGRALEIEATLMAVKGEQP